MTYPKQKRTDWEHHEQVEVVRFLERQRSYGNVIMFTSNPRETYTGSFYQNNKNKAAGLRSGLPDLLVLLKKYMVWIEMKRPRPSPSVISFEQQEWINALNQYGPPCRATVCYGAVEAISLLTNLIGDVSTPTQTDTERNQSSNEFYSFIHGKK